MVDRIWFYNFFTNTDSHILSKRNNANNYYEQLNSIGLSFLKNRSILLSSNTVSKKEWLMNNYNTEEVCIIGDGADEIDTAYEQTIKTILVNTGLTDMYQLNCQRFKNFKIINNINEFLNVFK